MRLGVSRVSAQHAQGAAILQCLLGKLQNYREIGANALLLAEVGNCDLSRECGIDHFGRIQ